MSFIRYDFSELTKEQNQTIVYYFYNFCKKFKNNESIMNDINLESMYFGLVNEIKLKEKAEKVYRNLIEISSYNNCKNNYQEQIYE